MAEQLTSADFGVTTGLFPQEWWFGYKFVNIERSAMADKLQPIYIYIYISFTKYNSEVTIDVLVFIFEAESFIIDCESGFVKK